MVVLTHLHWDHVGGLELIPTAVPDRDPAGRVGSGPRPRGRPAQLLPPRDYAGAGHEVVLLDGEHDLLGDGSIRLLPTPGHTPGHQSVRVGNLVIGADVTHFASGLDDHRFPVFAEDHGSRPARPSACSRCAKPATR